MFFPSKAVGKSNYSETRKSFHLSIIYFPLALRCAVVGKSLLWNQVQVAFPTTMDILVKPGLQRKPTPTEEGTLTLAWF